MRNITRILCLTLVLSLFALVFKDYVKPAAADSPDITKYTSFKDVPGVTEDEIRAIEALQKRTGAFVYGMPVSTEAFQNEDGELRGYTSLLCEWLTEFFGIPFRPELFEWLDLLAGLKTGEISFSGELTPTEERMKIYSMTSAIASRPLKYYRIAGGRPLEDIAEERLLRCGFIEGTATINTVVSELEPGTFEVIQLSDTSLVYGALKSGEIDAFYYSGTAEANFVEYSDLITLDFYPLIYRPVSLATQDPELEPIISVVEKVLKNGGMRYLTTLYNQGEQEYLKYKMHTLLTDEERAYIKNNPVVYVGADPGNYPGCFYDKREKEWKGVFFDLLDEVASLTGLSFERANDEHTEWPEIFQMLVSGDVSFVPELTRSKEREGQFLWPNFVELTDYYALISNSDYRDIKINEILYVKVGVAKNTAYGDIFRKWFPDHMYTFEYESMEEAFGALQRGEIDMVMANRKRLLYLTHYMELPNYKVNVEFDMPLYITMGFNKDEAVICSIIDKAVRMIDAEGIAERWMRRTYDYRAKVIEAQMEAQRPWLYGAFALFAVILILTVVLLHIKNNHAKNLRQLVHERTKELETQTSILQTIFDSTPDLLFCMDLNLNYLQINRSVEKYFNILEKDAIGKSIAAVLNMPEEIIRDIEGIEKKVLNERTAITREEILSTYDGREIILETTKVPLLQNGELIGILGIAHDITQRKAIEEEAMAASRAKSTFLANMSHELRTPLNVIIGLTDLMLEEEKLPASVMINLHSVGNAGGTLLSIVNDILDISKIESGKLTLVPIAYHMPSILNDTITVMKTQLGGKPIDFWLNIRENLPAMLYGDELRVRQIINNLLSNAVKYTHEGTIELSVECERDGSDVWMNISVKDTGIGIREEDLENLFNDYYQADDKANRKTEGTGLGLSIARRMVQMMDGNITADSEYGRGSTFRVRLRQGFVSDTQIGEDIAENLRNFSYRSVGSQTHNKMFRSNLSGNRVLVVDDIQNNLDVASGLLRKYNMKVDCVLSGQAAVDRIRRQKPFYNAVFMDHMMPDMDGIESAKAIRALDTEYALNVPIIALTANAITGTEKMFFENGFQDFLSKPIDLTRLDSVVKKWVSAQIEEYDANYESEPDIPAPVPSAVNEDVTIDIPGVESQKGLTLYNGDNDIYLSTLRSYAANTPVILDKLRGASAEKMPDCIINAHSLKGSSANICAERVRTAAAEMESVARSGDSAKFLTLLGPCLKDAEELVKNINAWFEAYDARYEKPRRGAPDGEILAKLKRCCESYDMSGIDEAMEELERYSYDTGADLASWLREKVDTMELDEVVERLSEENL